MSNASNWYFQVSCVRDLQNRINSLDALMRAADIKREILEWESFLSELCPVCGMDNCECIVEEGEDNA
jgi:hypothetical protein